MQLASAMRHAAFRAYEVWWAGIMALIFWLAAITLGPLVEARWFPVMTHYEVYSLDMGQRGRPAFRPIFTKSRDCHFNNGDWYVQDQRGRMIRMDVRRRVGETGPTSRPVGQHIGGWWEVMVPTDFPAAIDLYGVLSYSCGLPWETRTVVGPLRVPTR